MLHIVIFENRKKLTIRQCQPTNAEVVIATLIQGPVGLLSKFTHITEFPQAPRACPIGQSGILDRMFGTTHVQ